MTNQFTKLLDFLERLDDAKIQYTMEHSRDDAVMVSLVVPGEYWEIEFLADGGIDVERYRSGGAIHDEGILDELFTKYAADAEHVTEETVTQP